MKPSGGQSGPVAVTARPSPLQSSKVTHNIPTPSLPAAATTKPKAALGLPPPAPKLTARQPSIKRAAYAPLPDHAVSSNSFEYDDTPEPADCEILDPDELGLEDWELDSSLPRPSLVSFSKTPKTVTSTSSSKNTPPTSQTLTSPLTRETLSGVLVRAPLAPHDVLETDMSFSGSSEHIPSIPGGRRYAWRSPSPASSIESFGMSVASESTWTDSGRLPSSSVSAASDRTEQASTPRKIEAEVEPGEILEPSTPTRPRAIRAEAAATPSLLDRLSPLPNSTLRWPLPQAYRDKSQSSSVITTDSLLPGSLVPSSTTSLAPSASASNNNSRTSSPKRSLTGPALAAKLNSSLTLDSRWSNGNWTTGANSATVSHTQPERMTTPRRGRSNARIDDDDAMELDVTPKRDISFRPVRSPMERALIDRISPIKAEPIGRILPRMTGCSNISRPSSPASQCSSRHTAGSRRSRSHGLPVPEPSGWNKFSSAETYEAYISNGLSGRYQHSSSYYAHQPLETRLSDRHWPDPPRSARERTVLVGPIPDDVFATELFGLLIRKVGPVDNVKVNDGVAAVVFEYAHAERARRARK